MILSGCNLLYPPGFLLPAGSNGTGTSGNFSMPGTPFIYAVAISTNQIVIIWSPVTNATSYNIYWSTNSNVSKTNGEKIPGVTSPYTNIEPLGTTNYYVATALNSNGESTESPDAFAIPAPYITGELIVNATDSIGIDEKIYVYAGYSTNEIISNATITLNGTNINYDPVTTSFSTNLTISPGSLFTLDVKLEGFNYSLSGTQYSNYPTVTFPTDNMVWFISSDNVITWTPGAPTNGSSYFAGVYISNISPLYSQYYFGTNQKPYLYIPVNTSSISVPTNSWTNLSTPTNMYVIMGILSLNPVTSNGLHVSNALTASSIAVGAANIVPIILSN
jgi:hypothetical protein